MCGLAVTCKFSPGYCDVPGLWIVWIHLDHTSCMLMLSVMTVQFHRLYLLLQHIKSGFAILIDLLTGILINS